MLAFFDGFVDAVDEGFFQFALVAHGFVADADFLDFLFAVDDDDDAVLFGFDVDFLEFFLDVFGLAAKFVEVFELSEHG